MASGNGKDLTRGTAFDKILRDKAFHIAKNPKYDLYQRRIASMFYKFFDRKSSGSGIKIENMSDQQLAEESQKLSVRNFKKKKALIFYR